MTCIVALEYQSGAWIGSDSFMGTSHQRDRSQRPKVWSRGGMAVGHAGSFRTAQLIEHCIRFRPIGSSESVHRYLVSEVAKKIRTTLNGAGASVREHGTDSQDAELVVVVRGEVWTIQGDYAALRSTRGFAASGTGAPYALGALLATPDMEPRRRILTALQAAAEFSPSVCEPFEIQEVRCSPRSGGKRA